jgi:uncharacterized PurR-regulated membrane protein YhhQ (DUF165 family)
MRRLGFAAAALFVSTVVAANWAVQEFGLVHVGFGLVAPAGVYFAGLAFLLRDLVQRTLGRPWVLAAIAAGGAVSALVSPRLALASSVAFTVSELADMAVYTRLERRGITAVVGSNIVGAAVDSALFLQIAFGSLAFWEGQMVGKLWVTVAALPILVLSRRRLALEEEPV